jgi:DNA-directed RNA polymerase I, II, and III subunit RPABC2
MSYFGGDDENEYVESEGGSVAPSESDNDDDDSDIPSVLGSEYGDYHEESEVEAEPDSDNDELEKDNEMDDENEEQTGGAEDDDFDESDIPSDIHGKQIKNVPTKGEAFQRPANYIPDEEEDDGEEADNGDQYLQKLDRSLNENYILDNHPESILHNYDEIEAMSKVVRDNNGIIVDDLHRTIPFLTKYERARILGQRAIQINAGAPPFVKVPENVIDGLIIARMELEQKRIPYIIRRPLPNGGSEYWKIADLEDIAF